jgi:hypothetical protein
MTQIPFPIVHLTHNLMLYEPSHRLMLTAMFSCMVFNDSSSSPVNWGVGIPNVMLYHTNPRIIAGHVANGSVI